MWNDCGLFFVGISILRVRKITGLQKHAHLQIVNVYQCPRGKPVNVKQILPESFFFLSIKNICIQVVCSSPQEAQTTSSGYTTLAQANQKRSLSLSPIRWVSVEPFLFIYYLVTTKTALIQAHCVGLLNKFKISASFLRILLKMIKSVAVDL